MRSARILLALRVVAALATIASAAGAQTFPAGSGTFSGKGTLRISGCGKVSARSDSANYALDANGVFTETDTGSQATIVGAAQPVGMSGRTFAISYAAGAFDEFAPLVEQASGLICESTFTLATIQGASSLKLNKRRNRAKLKGVLSYTGASASGSHSATLKTKEGGGWAPAS